MRLKKLLEGIFEVNGRRKSLATLNSSPGRVFFDEKLYNVKGREYREWDPSRSKFAAYILKEGKVPPIKKDSIMLYLGASHGYTASFFSDIITKGMIFAVDFAPRVVRDLYFLSLERRNIAPIMADANRPKEFAGRVCEADILYQDVAQRDQPGIFLKNINAFLKKGGYGFLAVKARSIDMSKKPSIVFKEVKKELSKSVDIVDEKVLSPFEKDHMGIVVKKR